MSENETHVPTASQCILVLSAHSPKALPTGQSKAWLPRGPGPPVEGEQPDQSEACAKDQELAGKNVASY
jgi:hypothetical protein